MTKDLVSWEGEPETGDLDKLKGWEPPDPVVMLNRQRIIAAAYRSALLLWSVMVAFTLTAMIFTGSLLFWITGYAVTVPYLLVCYKYQGQVRHLMEVRDYCEFDGCDLP